MTVSLQLINCGWPRKKLSSSFSYYLIFVMLVLRHCRSGTLLKLITCVSHIMVGAKRDKSFPGFNECRRLSNGPSSIGTPQLKSYKVMKLMKLSLCATYIILLCGDTCPQLGPLIYGSLDIPSINIRRKGLLIAHLNIRSLYPVSLTIKRIMQNTART